MRLRKHLRDYESLGKGRNEDEEFYVVEITDRKPLLMRKRMILTLLDEQLIGRISIHLSFIYQTNIFIRARRWQTIHADMGKIY